MIKKILTNTRVWIDNNPQRRKMACGERAIRSLLQAGILNGDDPIYASPSLASEPVPVRQTPLSIYLPTGQYAYDIKNPRTIFQLLDEYTIRSHVEPLLTLLSNWKQTLCHVLGQDLKDRDRQTVNYRYWGPIATEDGVQRFILMLELVAEDGSLSRQLFREILVQGKVASIILPNYNLDLAELIVEGNPRTGRFL